MYCGMSLARVGLDIRGLLPPIFEACVLNLFSKVGCLNAFQSILQAAWFVVVVVVLELLWLFL